jgi:fatty acid desaturase
MPTTPALPAILESELALQAAWTRKDRIAAADLRARLATLWAQRRTELAALSKRTPSGWDAMPFSVRRQA